MANPETTRGTFSGAEMTRLIAILLASFSLLAVTACNTVRGAGEDLKSAADAVDNET